MNKFFPFGLILLMLASCSTSQDVVQDGLFQKRKYFKKGWFVDKPITRGMEELEQEEIVKDQVKPPRDPYLQMIPTVIHPQQEDDQELLTDVHLVNALSGRTIPDASVLPEETPTEGLVHSRTAGTATAISSTPRLPEPELGVAVPFLATSLAILLPTALLFLLLLLIHRLIRSDESGSLASVLALLMGMLGLAALAMI